MSQASHYLLSRSLLCLGGLHTLLVLTFIPLISEETKLVDSGLVLLVDVPLVEEDEEHDVVPEASKSVHGWHFDHEGKDVVNEGVESLVGHHPPRQVGDRL